MGWGEITGNNVGMHHGNTFKRDYKEGCVAAQLT